MDPLEKLQKLQACLNETLGYLEGKKSLDHIDRFPEKNYMSQKCVHAYDSWYKSHMNWMKSICHESKEIDRCTVLENKFREKDRNIRETMITIFHKASLDELEVYRMRLDQIEKQQFSPSHQKVISPPSYNE